MDKVMEFIPFMLEGAVVTVELFALTLVISLPLGLPIALGSNSRIKPLSFICKVYVWIFRGTPLLLQLFFFYFFFPLVLNIQMNAFITVVLTYVLNYAAYFAEIYRGGIESIPKGQYEAAEVLGYSKVQTFWKIIFPQMVKRVLPPVTNEVITLVKDTSLAFSLAYMEMFTIAKQIVAKDSTVVPFIVAAVFYYVFNFVVAAVMENIEKRMSYYK